MSSWPDGGQGVRVPPVLRHGLSCATWCNCSGPSPYSRPATRRSRSTDQLRRRCAAGARGRNGEVEESANEFSAGASHAVAEAGSYKAMGYDRCVPRDSGNASAPAAAPPPTAAPSHRLRARPAARGPQPRSWQPALHACLSRQIAPRCVPSRLQTTSSLVSVVSADARKNVSVSPRQLTDGSALPISNLWEVLTFFPDARAADSWRGRFLGSRTLRWRRGD